VLAAVPVVGRADGNALGKRAVPGNQQGLRRAGRETEGWRKGGDPTSAISLMLKPPRGPDP